MIKARLAKLEGTERERLCAEAQAVQTTVTALVRTFFNESQLHVLDLLCKAGDPELYDLTEAEQEAAYAQRRQQAPLDVLRQSLASQQWLLAQLEAVATKGSNDETNGN